MMRLIRFLGSIYLAIFILGSLAIYTAAGTFLESAYDSHGYASRFTYSHPIFLCTLILAFVNILVSALLRWPFKKRHIPFLLTHLGLLMIIAGALIKIGFGLQAHLILVEGGGSHQAIIPSSYSIQLEKRPERFDHAPEKEQWHVKDLTPGMSWNSHFGSLNLKAVYPHSTEKQEVWTKGDKVYIRGLDPLPLVPWPPQTGDQLPTGAAVSKNGKVLFFYAFKTPFIPDLMKRIYAENADLVIIDSLLGDEYARIPLKKALKGKSSLNDLSVHAKLEIPFSLTEGLHPPHLKVWLNEEERLIELQGQYHGINQIPSGSYFNKLPYQVIIQHRSKIAVIHDQDGVDHLFVTLPNGKIESTSFGKLSSLYVYSDGFDGYGVHTPVLDGTLTLETSLTQNLTPEEPLDKLEENAPLVIIEKDGEDYPLRYDRHATSLKWPLQRGGYRTRFQPLEVELPFHLRLKHAEQFTYPHSQQPYSYEASLWLRDEDGQQKLISLSMNQVYETSRGYRLYLSNVSPGTPDRAAKIQLTVNYDPVKYWLTYPGGLIMAIGIFLLFTPRKLS